MTSPFLIWDITAPGTWFVANNAGMCSCRAVANGSSAARSVVGALEKLLDGDSMPRSASNAAMPSVSNIRTVVKEILRRFNTQERYRVENSAQAVACFATI